MKNNNLIKVLPLFLLSFFITIYSFFSDGINIYVSYSILALLFIMSIVVITYNQKKNNDSRKKIKNKLITFSVTALLSILMSGYFIFKQS
jgi:uncharacterized membrane protein